jgi:hypothetical protein
MPYLNFETSSGRAEIDQLISELAENRDRTQSELPESPRRSANQMLIKAYLYHHPPLHVPRTLDQFYFSRLGGTEHRDQDQVVYRYTANRAGQILLTVDQLWLWILGEGDISNSIVLA